MSRSTRQTRSSASFTAQQPSLDPPVSSTAVDARMSATTTHDMDLAGGGTAGVELAVGAPNRASVTGQRTAQAVRSAAGGNREQEVPPSPGAKHEEEDEDPLVRIKGEEDVYIEMEVKSEHGEDRKPFLGREGGVSPEPEVKPKIQPSSRKRKPFPSAHPGLPFPADVITCILVSPSIRQHDLAKLCLVSRAFLPLARQQLYHSLVIHLEDNDRNHISYRTKRMADVLSSSPELAAVVRELVVEHGLSEYYDDGGLLEHIAEDLREERLHVPSDAGSDWSADGDSMMDYEEASWILRGLEVTGWQDVFSYFPELPALFRLSLPAEVGRGWGNFEDSSEFFASADSPSSRLVHFSLSTFSPITAQHFPSLTSLSTPFDQFFFDSELSQLGSPPTLTHLDITSMTVPSFSPAFEWLVSSSIDSLTHLSLPLDPTLFSHTLKLPALQHLTLYPDLSPGSSSYGDVVEQWLQRLPPSLVSLTIDGDPKHYLSNLISAPPPSLRQLTFRNTPLWSVDLHRAVKKRGDWLPALSLLRLDGIAAQEPQPLGWGAKPPGSWTSAKVEALRTSCRARRVRFEWVMGRAGV